jgi:heterotetrameric sarcosine oxidase delta subunit
LNCSDEAWADYMFNRDNPSGPHAERWRHTFGCSQWFNLLRDTATHEVTSIYGITEEYPGGPS